MPLIVSIDFDPRLTNGDACANETKQSDDASIEPTVAQRAELGVAGGDVQIADVLDQREIEIAARRTQCGEVSDGLVVLLLTDSELLFVLTHERDERELLLEAIGELAQVERGGDEIGEKERVETAVFDALRTTGAAVGKHLRRVEPRNVVVQRVGDERRQAHCFSDPQRRLRGLLQRHEQLLNLFALFEESVHATWCADALVQIRQRRHQRQCFRRIAKKISQNKVRQTSAESSDVSVRVSFHTKCCTTVSCY